MSQPYALITGASAGIGFQYALEMAQRNYNLIIVSNEESIREKADEIKAQHPELDVVPVVKDLARPEAAKEMYDWCQEQNYEVEVLINNAGVYHWVDFLDDSEKFNQLILTLHVTTPAMMVYYFAKDMVARHRGYILNMSSVSSGWGIQRLATYTATKAFLRTFSRSMHIELKRKGVNLTCVRPGAVATTLYGLDDARMKLGRALGVITGADKLARKGVKAMFRGKCCIAPGFYTKILKVVPYIPTWIWLLLRRMGKL